MTTPVLFLDEASRYIGKIDPVQAKRSAMALINTLRELRKINKLFALNLSRPLAQYQIAENWTLQATLAGAAFKDEWDFIRLLNDRSPFSAEFADVLAQEVRDLEFRTVQSRVPSSALGWAMMVDTATISFDAHPDWAPAWVDIECISLNDDGDIGVEQRTVRNASQIAHAAVHIEWLKLLGLVSAPTAAHVWTERAMRFPGLRFLPRFEKDLTQLAASGLPFASAITALQSLASDATNWASHKPWPDFSIRPRPEHIKRRSFCWVHDDQTGKKELFDLHISFNGGLFGRIHFRVDSTSRSIVVAYAGDKLMSNIPS